MKISLLCGLLLLSLLGFSKDVVIKKATNDIIVVSPAPKQLNSLGWPNDIINSIAIKTNKGIVLVDTQNSPANATLIKNAVIKYFNDSTFVYVINTHGHSCHSGGNCIFDNSKIVAQENNKREIQNYDDIYLGQTVEFLRKKIDFKNNILDTIKTANAMVDSINESIDLYRFYENDLINNYHPRFPDLTFDERLSLNSGNKTINLYYMGKGHGDADIMVYIKEDKVLCTGNLFHLGSYAEEAMPSFYLNRPNEINHWISTMNDVLQEDIDKVISIHGKRFFSKKNIEFIRDYCVAVQEKVKEAKATNTPIEEIQKISTFKNVFNKYSSLINKNEDLKRMHARNIEIIWEYIE